MEEKRLGNGIRECTNVAVTHSCSTQNNPIRRTVKSWCPGIKGNRKESLYLLEMGVSLTQQLLATHSEDVMAHPRYRCHFAILRRACNTVYKRGR